jgi:hypothetical protein
MNLTKYSGIDDRLVVVMADVLGISTAMADSMIDSDDDIRRHFTSATLNIEALIERAKQ